jgi:uncharacterized protein
MTQGEQGQQEERNREIVRRAFEAWAQGTGDVFDLLTPDASWTIMGSGPSARTYHGRQAYVDAAVTPLTRRLSGHVAPRLRGLWADEDHVIVRWDQEGRALDGQPYNNSYAWFLRMRDGRVIAVTDFLDLPAYDALLGRVKPAAEDTR